ncbi:MAG: macro domain-containing protein [Algicola sp.]|nr:macro domain-containing protein [Algicola sp.]
MSGAIKKHAGTTPFKQVSKYGAIPLGEARMTSAGKLDFDHIIHVAGINMLGFATQYSVTQSVINAMAIVNQHKISSVSFEGIESEAEVIIVQYPY